MGNAAVLLPAPIFSTLHQYSKRLREAAGGVHQVEVLGNGADEGSSGNFSDTVGLSLLIYEPSSPGAVDEPLPHSESADKPSINTSSLA